jgi:NAD(P)H-dependent FMN reductase
VFELFEIDESLRAAPFRTALDGLARRALSRVENADALIVGAPTTGAGSYPGLLHHFFDLADPALMRGKPVVVVATGSLGVNPRLVKLQLRLLFRSLGARPVPTAIYADNSALRQATLDQPLQDQIALANAELARMLIAGARKDGSIGGDGDDADELGAIWPARADVEQEAPPDAGRVRPKLRVVR